MNTEEIIAGCRALANVHVRTEEAYTELRLSRPDGDGCMRFYPVFSGVTLAKIAVNAPIWPAPSVKDCAPETCGPLLINYCQKGRCELVLNDGRSVFLTEGHIALTEKFAQREYLYPGNVYEGIEIFVDPDMVKSGLPALWELFGIDLPALRKKYCPEGKTYIAKMALPEELLARLCPADGDAIGRKTGVVTLFALLLSEEAHEETMYYYTRSQVEIARQTEHIILHDLSVVHTVRELAQRFGVSEGSVKNYFRGVYGQSISAYTTHRRMSCAAELLRTTNLSVLEVANRVGYENQSKFAAAFKRVYGCSPFEYRRKENLAL